MIRKSQVAALGTVASALAVASCCIGPVLFLLFGTTIGALSSLGVLTPYRIYFIAAGVSLWSYGFYGLYMRRLEPAGACGKACERPSKTARVMLWLALGVLVAAILLPNMAVYYAG